MKNTPHPNPLPQGAREQEVSPFDLAAFVAQFPLFARAPNGIANLRALILQLAVQGKLTEQNPDENIEATLKQIKQCQENWIASQTIRKQKSLQKISDDEKNFTIPSNWVWTRLNDWGVWRSGATPRRDHAGLYGGNIPWFKSGELTGDVITSSEEYITDKALKESAVKLHAKGTVLLAMYGATIGKTAILGIDATTNQAVCGCQCYDGISNVYLLVLLKAYNSYFSSQGAGGAQPNISREKIIVTPVPLPPLEEQQRIVAKVDELMALCDQLEAQQDDQARNLLEANTAVVQAVMQPADAFNQHWQRIATHFNTLYGTNLPLPSDMRRGKLKERTVALQNITKLRQLVRELGLKGKLTNSDSTQWKWHSFASLGENRLGKMLDQAKNSGTAVKYLRNTNVQWYRFELDDLLEMKVEEHELPKITILPGDLVICEGGEAGRAAIWNGEPIVIQKALHRFRCNDELFNQYALLCLRTDVESGRLAEYYTGATIKHFTGKALKDYTIPLPPLAEQQRIVAQVDELMALCDTLETLLDEQRQVATAFSAAAMQAMEQA